MQYWSKLDFGFRNADFGFILIGNSDKFLHEVKIRYPKSEIQALQNSSIPTYCADAFVKEYNLKLCKLSKGGIK